MTGVQKKKPTRCAGERRLKEETATDREAVRIRRRRMSKLSAKEKKSAQVAYLPRGGGEATVYSGMESSPELGRKRG